MKQNKTKSEGNNTIKHFWRSLRTPDKYLLIILSICLFHTVFTLIMPLKSGDSSAVDIVTRTTAATIFGYFISGNFLRQSGDLQSNADNAPLQATNFALNNTDITAAPLQSTSIPPNNSNTTFPLQNTYIPLNNADVVASSFQNANISFNNTDTENPIISQAQQNFQNNPSPKPQKQPVHYSVRQITIVALIGTISLFILLSANYTQASATHTAAASSQLRDFVLGSVGFLISGSNKNTNTP